MLHGATVRLAVQMHGLRTYCERPVPAVRPDSMQEDARARSTLLGRTPAEQRGQRSVLTVHGSVRNALLGRPPCGLAAERAWPPQVKTRLQSEGKHTTADRRYTGSVDAVTRIWQTEGAGARAPLGSTRSACAALCSGRLSWRRPARASGRRARHGVRWRHSREAGQMAVHQVV